MHNDESVILVYKGTSYKTIIQIQIGDGKYQLANGEKIIFGVKTSTDSNNYIIKKVLTRNDHSESSVTDYVLSLSPSDTNVQPYMYRLEIGIELSGGNYHVIFPEPCHKAYLKICDTVTKMGDGNDA